MMTEAMRWLVLVWLVFNALGLMFVAARSDEPASERLWHAGMAGCAAVLSAWLFTASGLFG